MSALDRHGLRHFQVVHVLSDSSYFTLFSLSRGGDSKLEAGNTCQTVVECFPRVAEYT